MESGRRERERRSKDAADWVRAILRRKNWTGTDLARRAELAPSTLLRALNDPKYRFAFMSQTLQKIADAAGEAVPPNLLGWPPGDRSRTRIGTSVVDQSAIARRVELKIVSALPTKIRAQQQSRSVEEVYLPVRLAHDETAFAFRNPDESLGAWFKPRCVMYASKCRDPTGGDLVMLTSKDGRTRVRLVLSIDETGLSLSRSMPPQADEKVRFDDIGDIAVIVEVAMG